MVNSLEVKANEFVDLRKLVKDNYKVLSQDNYGKTYACDCDSFDGGDAPCDCNR